VRALGLHGPTITGRIRDDPGLLLLTGLVVALAAALTSAVAPLTERTADRAIEHTVRDAGTRATVVATFPRQDEDPDGQARDPGSVRELRQDADYAQHTMPDRLAAVVSPGVTSLTTPPLQLVDAGPGRYLRLAYLDTPQGPPAVTYTAGGPPQPSTDGAVPADDALWPVQVALSEASATALGLEPGDRLPAEDVQHRRVDVRISGIFVAASPRADAWLSSPELLHPVQGVTEGVERISAAALVSPEALPDLRLAVPTDDLTERVVFNPQPDELSWRGSSALARSVVSLKSSTALARGRISWDSLLDRVLADGQAQVATARGQAQVVLLGLLGSVLLVLALAARLLVRRRAGSVAMARERGAALLGIGTELLVEALLVALAGAGAGVLATLLLVGAAGWGLTVPVVLVAALGAPVLGVLVAAGSTDVRRVPANRSARRTAARSRRLRRYLVEATVVAVAALTFVALRQRGVTGGDLGSGDPTAASAPVWWTVAGTLVVLRVFPGLAGFVLGRARGSRTVVGFVVGARLAQVGARLLPLLVVTVTVAQLTLGISLAATEQHGQTAGALLAVGGDARVTAVADPSVTQTARDVAAAPGVDEAVAGRVADDVQASSRESAATVTLVVVDAAAYERLLAASPLPDAPQLAKLQAGGAGDPVPALLLGGDPRLRIDPVLRWDDVPIALSVVGVAPQVEAATGPVVVVDAAAFAATGAAADPDTVWAVGPGSAAAVRHVAGPAGEVELLDDVLAARRDAPLASGLVHLAVAVSALLLLLAVLGVVLGAALEAPARAESLGRLRSLGLGRAELWRLLAGELLTPVVVGSVAGLLLGLGCALTSLGSLELEKVTGEAGSPDLVVPWWAGLTLVVPLAAALLTTQVEARRLRRTGLARLLRAGDQR